MTRQRRTNRNAAATGLLPSQPQEPWTSVEDVAKHLGVTTDSVYRWIANKQLPAHRIGRLWKFKLTQVDKWVTSGGAAPDACS